MRAWQAAGDVFVRGRRGGRRRPRPHRGRPGPERIAVQHFTGGLPADARRHADRRPRLLGVRTRSGPPSRRAARLRLLAEALRGRPRRRRQTIRLDADVATIVACSRHGSTRRRRSRSPLANPAQRILAPRHRSRLGLRPSSSGRDARAGRTGCPARMTASPAAAMAVLGLFAKSARSSRRGSTRHVAVSHDRQCARRRSGLILIIAAVNVAGLLLAPGRRAPVRAGGARVARRRPRPPDRQLLTESVVLAVPAHRARRAPRVAFARRASSRTFRCRCRLTRR